jgi:hypothetical protein
MPTADLAEPGQVRNRVRARYAQAAETVMAGGTPQCPR